MTIRKHSAAFSRSYSHWGITEIPRPEWLSILSDLERFQSEISHVLGNAGQISPISKSFCDNNPAAVAMICDLKRWIEATLASHDTISVLGV